MKPALMLKSNVTFVDNVNVDRVEDEQSSDFGTLATNILHDESNK